MTLSPLSTKWPYPLLQTSEDKTLSRIGVGQGFAHELVGVEGIVEGDLRPFKGFQKVYELELMSQSPTGHTVASVVKDIFPVNFRVGSNAYAYGFVYRATRGASTTQADVFVDFWSSATDTTAFGTKGELVMTNVSATDKMDVQVFGRMVYVFIEGRSPAMFYLKEIQQVEFPMVDFKMASIDQSAITTNDHSPNLPVSAYLGGNDKRLLMQFDTSAYATSTISDLRLNLNVLTVSGMNATSTELDIARLTKTDWDPLVATWSIYKTASNWAKTGGDWDFTSNISKLGPSVPGSWQSDSLAGTVVDPATWATGQVDLIMMPKGAPESGQTETLTSVPQSPENTSLIYEAVIPHIGIGRPVLTATLTTPVYTLIKLGNDTSTTGGLPGPGKQPLLTSPSSATALGSFSQVTNRAERPTAGQVVLTLQSPDQSGLFPDDDTGTPIVPTPPWWSPPPNVNEGDTWVPPVVEETVTITPAVNTAASTTFTSSTMTVAAGEVLVVFVSAAVTTTDATVGDYPTAAATNPQTTEVDPLLVNWNATEQFTQKVDSKSDYEGAFLTVAGPLTAYLARMGAYVLANPSATTASVTVKFKEDPLNQTIVAGIGKVNIVICRVSGADTTNPFALYGSRQYNDVNTLKILRTRAHSDGDWERDILGDDWNYTTSDATTSAIACQLGMMCPISRDLTTAAPQSVVRSDAIIGLTPPRTGKILSNGEWRSGDGSSGGDYGVWVEFDKDYGNMSHTAWVHGVSLKYRLDSDPSSIVNDQNENGFQAIVGIRPAVQATTGGPSTNTGTNTSFPSDVFPTGFSTQMNQFVVVLDSPSLNQTDVSVNSRLNWSGFFSSGGGLPDDMVWDVYFGEFGSGGIPRVARSLPAPVTSWDPGILFSSGRLKFSQKYTWKVVARRSDFPSWAGSTSSTGVFETEGRFSARKLEPGDYTFGYLLYDSRTGRRSAFSKIAQCKQGEFAVQTQGTSFLSQYAAFEIIYDADKFDQAYFYRSVKIQDAGGTDRAALMSLDAIVTLNLVNTILNEPGEQFSEANGTFRHAVYYFQLEDKQLVYQQPFLDRAVFDEQMPYGGAAYFHETTMLVSSITGSSSTADENREFDAQTGLGEIRYSSLVDISPELFPPFNRATPATPSSTVIKFEPVSGNVIGLARDRLFFIRKFGDAIQIQEMHEGFGTVSNRASQVIGPNAYFVTDTGLATVGPTGQLDNVRILDSLLKEEWGSDLADLSMSYDPTVGILTILNPTKEEAACIWFRTSRVTEMEDMTFDLTASGVWPSNFDDTTDYVNELEHRAFFVQNNPATTPTTFTTWKPRVFMMDWAGRRKISGSGAGYNGQDQIRTIGYTGDSRFTVSAVSAAAGGIFTLTPSTGSPTPPTGSQVGGMYLYVLDAPTAHSSLIGKKFHVELEAGGVYICTDNADQGALKTAVDAGADVVRVGLSPVPFRWVGSPVGLTLQGQQFDNDDFFRIKHMDSVGAAFTDVTGPPTGEATTYDDRYAGLVYLGTEATAKDRRIVVNEDGNAYKSVVDGEPLFVAAFGVGEDDGRYGVQGSVVTPGLEIICPDLDFKLIGAIARGRILGTERGSTARSQ